MIDTEYKSWQRNARLIYNAVPQQRIGNFEVIKTDTEVFLIEHCGYTRIWMATCFDDEWRLYLPLYQLVYGKVLIAGLGLGCDLLNVASRQNVDEITLVEKQQEIIDLVWPHIPHDKTTLVCQDIAEFLRTTDDQFDLIYFDIFPGGRASFPIEAEQLLELAQSHLVGPYGQVVFWEEE